ncbi:hypothetical protein PC123_g25007 [Phytophthora cactorum]|nr:hypothetical protein PC123_g25007 [Phytophthora cactorum]
MNVVKSNLLQELDAVSGFGAALSDGAVSALSDGGPDKTEESRRRWPKLRLWSGMEQGYHCAREECRANTDGEGLHLVWTCPAAKRTIGTPYTG